MTSANKFKELDRKEMGRRLRSQREAMHLSREALAAEIDISPKFLIDIENGDKGMSMQTLYKFMQHLNISADFLIETNSSSIAEDSAELAQLRENILAPLSVCNAQQLHCMEHIVRYYVEAIMCTAKVD